MLNPKTLTQIWNKRNIDRIPVMRISDKTIYWILNQDASTFETFSTPHGILRVGMVDAEQADWIEWDPSSSPTLH